MASNLLLIGLYKLFGQWVLPTDHLMAGLAYFGVTKMSFYWLFPYFLIGNPLIEEWFWRGRMAQPSSLPLRAKIVCYIGGFMYHGLWVRYE